MMNSMPRAGAGTEFSRKYDCGDRRPLGGDAGMLCVACKLDCADRVLFPATEKKAKTLQRLINVGLHTPHVFVANCGCFCKYFAPGAERERLARQHCNLALMYGMAAV
jgi:hypothetical protein